MGPKLTSMLAERRAAAADVDLDRMQRHRHVRLQAEMARKGVEVAVLLHAPNVTYATGLPPRAIDVTHAAFERPVAVVVAGEDRPHLLSDQDEPGSLVVRHPAVGPELDDGAIQLGQAVAEIAGPIAGRRVAVDVRTGPML